MKNLQSLIHHLFLPHEKNNYRAKLLHLDMLSVYLLITFFLTILFRLQFTSGEVLGYATDITIEKLLQLTNEERQKNNLPPLNYSPQLTSAAQAKAKDMFAKNYWAHYGPNGETPWTFILDSGYQYEFAGENLAKNFLISQGVVSAWMRSTTHRENILRPEYTDVGFAIVNGVLNGEQTTLVVQMFGKPLSKSLALPPYKQSNLVSPISSYQQQTSTLGLTYSLPKHFNLSLIFFSLLIIVLLIDLYIALRLNIIRIGGKNFIHLLFLIFITIALFIIRQGAII